MVTTEDCSYLQAGVHSVKEWFKNYTITLNMYSYDIISVLLSKVNLRFFDTSVSSIETFSLLNRTIDTCKNKFMQRQKVDIFIISMRETFLFVFLSSHCKILV